MKLYCQIENTLLEDGTETLVIKEGPIPLPQNAGNVSNLNILDDETLRLFGWVPVVTISENKEIVVSVNYTVYPDKVIETISSRDKSDEELAEYQVSEHQKAFENIREQRNKLLLESDKLVLIDRWEKLSTEEKEKIAEYRQLLRDLPESNETPQLIVFPTL
jgi:hypothetical protein